MMYNKEQFSKELEDAVNAGIRIKIDGYESHIIKDQLVQSYITTRLAALDDGEDWKAKYEKCINIIKRFDAGIIGMYDL